MHTVLQLFPSPILNMLPYLKTQRKLVLFDGWIVLHCVNIYAFSLYWSTLFPFYIINNVAITIDCIHTHTHVWICICVKVMYIKYIKLPSKKVGRFCIFLKSIWECLFKSIFVNTGIKVFILFLYELIGKTWYLISSLCILKIMNEREHCLWIACSYFYVTFFWAAHFLSLVCNSLLLMKEISPLSFVLKIRFPHLSFFFWLLMLTVLPLRSS